MKRFLNYIFSRGAEVVLSLALVLLFFLTFMGLLGLTFPEGTSLKALMSGGDDSPRAGSPRDIELVANYGADTRISFIARLTHTERTVKDKPANAIAWKNADEGLPLQDRHAVQTFADSGATISFNETNQLEMGENSLVVIKRLDESPVTRERRASLIVLGGDVRGTITVAGEQATELEIATPGGFSKIPVTGRDDREVEFEVTVNDDQSSTFAVYQGSMEVTVGGETMIVEPNHFVTVSADGLNSKLLSMPVAPLLAGPSDGTSYVYRDLPPEITFRWEASPETPKYTLQIARDPGFKNVVFKKKISGDQFTHGNLKAGRYYWRVLGAKGWAKGLASPSATVEIIEDRQAPALQVEFPTQPVAATTVVVRGEAEPGAHVFVDNQPVTTLISGQFEHIVHLQPGLNVVVVEAVDVAGNIAYASQLVSAKF
jgi:mannose-6-phosphate isomerase-like protein (cupin superfamily)